MLNDSALCDWAEGSVEEFGPISEEEQPQLAGNQAATYRNVWHTVRAGGSAADLAKIDTARIRHVRVNDGPLAPPASAGLETISERQYPGEGEFPLGDFLRALPKGLPIDIEAPSVHRAHAGTSAKAQAREAMAALRLALSAYLV